MTEIHQFVQSFVDHDAISSHVRHLQNVIRQMGIRSDVFAGEWRGSRSKAVSFRDFKGASAGENNSWILYHLSTASPIATYVSERSESVAVNYHNITPYQYLAPWEPLVAPELEVARRQLSDLAGTTKLAIGVSRFNEEELRAAGYRNTAVAPILFDPRDFSDDVDESVLGALAKAKSDGGSDWLFVGRITPHKCQHELVKALFVYRKLYDPRARLRIVGGVSSHLYLTVLKKYIEQLGLTDAVSLTLGASNGALGAYYSAADVFVCLSEHEGFGVPLLEAMHHGVPVVAFDAAAVGETVGYGGLVLNDKTPALVAASVNRVINDASLNTELSDRGVRRTRDFSLEAASQIWRELIEKMVNA